MKKEDNLILVERMIIMDNRVENDIINVFYKKNIVVITGAGISTLSGIPDFRGVKGLYKKNINAEEILSKKYFEKYPQQFYEFYLDNMICHNIKPNIIHDCLTSLEKSGNISCIITQNIDNLHQKSGSKNVIDLHGNGEEFYCINCHNNYDVSYYKNEGYICSDCGSIIRPNIVLYGEKVEEYKIWKCLDAIQKADKLIVLGSSLLVSTVGDLILNYIHLKHLVDNKNNSFYIFNNNSTTFDYFSNKCEDDLLNVFQKVIKYKN